MKVNEYKVLQDAVQRGIESGINKFMKYDEFQKFQEIPQDLKDLIEDYILLEICEYFKFDDFYKENEND